MALELFRHNEEAYKAVVSMLAERNKAAVVHPTGTGKSFIGFKLCYDNSDKIICWLSPSRYIYQTQLENLKEASGGYEPHNVKFYTYAKLMLLSDENFSEIKPDYIILDEFHRCGAEYWGMGVQKLLEMYPDTPLLGLSATAIRYLDNQRDMTDELFDGNIASEMTLGDAIVRGILDPPKYILSIFSYQKVKAAVLKAAEEYKAMGAELIECSMPSLKYAVPCYYLLACAEAASNLSRYDGIKYGHRTLTADSYEELIIKSRSEGFGEEVKRRILLGNYCLSSGYYDAYYRKAMALRQLIRKEYNDIFEKCDVILTPTTPAVAYSPEMTSDPVQMYQADICTVTVNIAGLPAISTPCGYDSKGMPIGMSVIGRKFDEATIIKTADAYEKGFKPVAPKL